MQRREILVPRGRHHSPVCGGKFDVDESGAFSKLRSGARSSRVMGKKALERF